MKKMILLLLTAAFLLLGCQSGESVAGGAGSKHLSIDPNFSLVSVSKTKSEDTIQFKDKESLETFDDLFSKAVKIPGIVDVAEHEFVVEISYGNEGMKELYMWIGEKGENSSFMKPEDTNTLYSVSEKETEELIELVESRFH